MKRGRERGFTLKEVLIVVAIIGIVVAFSIPAVGRFYLEYRLNKAAREVKANIQLARLKAVTSNSDVASTYNPSTNPTPDSNRPLRGVRES